MSNVSWAGRSLWVNLNANRTPFWPLSFPHLFGPYSFKGWGQALSSSCPSGVTIVFSFWCPLLYIYFTDLGSISPKLLSHSGNRGPNRVESLMDTLCIFLLHPWCWEAIACGIWRASSQSSSDFFLLYIWVIKNPVGSIHRLRNESIWIIIKLQSLHYTGYWEIKFSFHNALQLPGSWIR